MAVLVKLAIRNLWRNKRRTVLTFSVLALGIVWLIIVDSLARGLGNHSVQNIVSFETGELQVHAEGYFAERDKLPIDRLVPVDVAVPALLSVEGVRVVAPRVVTSARLNVGWEEFPVIAVAIDPRRDAEALDLMAYIEGNALEEGAAEALVGSGIARLLKIKQGDWITLLTRTRQGALQAIDLEVVGIVNTPHPQVNREHIYFPLQTADEALGLQGGATEIVVRLEPGVTPEEAAARVETALQAVGVNGEAIPWRTAAAELLALFETGTAFDQLLGLIVLVIALVGVTNTILLGALERKREIGTMKALGMREREVVLLFLLEATGIALLALAAGFGIGAAVNTYLVAVGFDLTSFYGEMDIGFPVPGKVYGSWNSGIFLLAGVAALVSCWIAAYLPARWAARQDAAATMRR